MRCFSSVAGIPGASSSSQLLAILLLLVPGCDDPSSPGSTEATHADTITATTWSNRNTHRLLRDVIVRDSLVIEPGTRVCAEAGASLIVNGKITAKGTKDRPITFTACNTATAWGGLHLGSCLRCSDLTDSLTHVRFEHAAQGINVRMSRHVFVDSAHLRYIAGSAIRVEGNGGSADVRRTIIDTVGIAVQAGGSVGLTDVLIRGTNDAAIIAGSRQFSSLNINGLRIEGAKGGGIIAIFASLPWSKPVRIVNSGAPLVRLPLNNIQSTWPGTHIDSLRGNIEDRIVVYNGVSGPGEIIVRPGMIFEGEQSAFNGLWPTIREGTTVVVERGGRVTNFALQGGRIVEQ